MESLVPSWLRLLRLISLLCAVVLVAVAVFVTISSGRERAAGAVDTGLLAATESQRQSLENYFARARAVIRLTAKNPAFAGYYDGPAAERPARLAEINDALGYLERLYPESIGEACLIDRTGTETARVVRGRIAADDDLSTEEASATFFSPTFRQRREVHQALPYVSPDTNEWVISNSTAIPTRTGATKAIVHFEVTTESFRRTALAESRHVTRIIDLETGRVVIDSRRPQRSRKQLGYVAEPSVVQAIRGGTRAGAAARMIEIDGTRSAVGVLSSTAGNENRWAVVVTPARWAGQGALRLGAGSVILIVLAIASVVVAFLSHRLSATALTRAALSDTLTGLPNRTRLHDRIERAIVRSRRSGRHTAVMLLDLDRFKEVNDTLGHHQGDMLLQRVAVRLQEALRAQDSVARLGGDEFAVLAEDLADPALALELAERIHSALCRPVTLGDVEVEVGASIGVAVHPAHADDVDGLLQRADVAMYAAKRARRDVALYQAEQDPYTAERLSLVGDLRRAIENRELELQFQPKYRLGDLELRGVEALVRWTHPRRGPLRPDEFIPLAEHTGLIKGLTDLVIDEALRQVVRWKALGHHVPVAVNVSARSLLDLTLPEQVQAALDRHALTSDSLALEITESTLIEDPDRALTVLGRLDAMGIDLAIDDFGTGYSSLAYLKRLPVSELKIDKGFVLNMAASQDDAAIVRSTIDLGQNLGLNIVAEGVEDAETLQALESMACNSAQGFYLGRPVGAAEIDRILGRVAPTST